MIENRIIVCIANSWDYDPTSKHHMMRILSRKNHILWVNYRGTRRPGFRRSDVRGVYVALRGVARGLRRISGSMVQLTPLVFPGVSDGILGRVHERLLILQIQRALAAIPGYGDKAVQVWSFAPDVAFLAGRLGEESFVYYCVDEYSQFEDLDGDRIALLEHDLLQRSDVVITSSEALCATKRSIRPDALLVRHGVDYEHFQKAWLKKPTNPADLWAIPGPIFGFFGLIQHWVDLDLLASVARMRPEYSFVIVGDCFIDVSALREMPNIYLLGRRPYADLPAYCAAFDAGLMFFKRNAMTRNINPIKMLEYLAAGLPIVSTPLPEAERYRGPITFAETPSDYASALDYVLATRYLGRRETISRIVRCESWESKVEELSSAVLSRLARRKRSIVMGEHPTSDETDSLPAPALLTAANGG